MSENGWTRITHVVVDIAAGGLLSLLLVLLLSLVQEEAEHVAHRVDIAVPESRTKWALYDTGTAL